jgi:outer membrane biosynthesis protein TonB
MSALRTLCGYALGISIPMASLAGAAPERLAAGLRMAVAEAVASARGEGRAEVAVAFDDEGRVASAALTRSAGSRSRDEAAREEALQLASLEPRGQVAGRTVLFTAVFGAAID